MSGHVIDSKVNGNCENTMMWMNDETIMTFGTIDDYLVC